MATLYEVLQLQRQRRETGPCPLNLENQRRYPRLPVVVREAVAADHVGAVSEKDWKRHLLQRRQERLA